MLRLSEGANRVSADREPAHRERARPEGTNGTAPVAGVRVVMDVRPLQEPERTPITASYLERLLAAFTARPVPGESFVAVLRTLRDDPTAGLQAAGLPVAGRRLLPPTSRVFRSAGLTLDSFLLRGAELGTGGGARESGASGIVYHTAGGAVPLASRLPVVATLLDLAPWELPETYARSAAARFGHRLRARVLHDARRVIVTSRATADNARRLLHLHDERISIVPLAADDAFRPGPAGTDVIAALRDRYDLPERYLVFAGRYDARKDFATLFAALHALSDEVAARGATPPVVVLAGAAGDEHADSPTVARLARRFGVADLVRLTPRLEPEALAALERSAAAMVLPVLSDATGLPALEALAVGIPVICSQVGPLPEIVGEAGIVVEPRQPERLVAALRVVWEGGAVATRLTSLAEHRAAGPRRTWLDVGEETRRVYAAAIAD